MVGPLLQLRVPNKPSTGRPPSVAPKPDNRGSRMSIQPEEEDPYSIINVQKWKTRSRVNTAFGVS